MAKNANLSNAKKKKNDEFYTRLEDIEKELNSYDPAVFKGNGDFRSAECVDLLKQSDMVVTNPPFSLFREFVAQLEQYHKKFIIWGNNNAIFPLIKEGKLWLGYRVNKTCYFKLSPDYPKWDEKFTAKMNDGNHYGKVPAISTFTNIDTKKRHHKLETVYRWHKRKEKYPDLYQKYDNDDAI